MKRRLAATLALVLMTAAPLAGADYLEVWHVALLKRSPESQGDLVKKLIPDTLVALESPDQENGYYRVRTRDGDEGYVYRTLVRRHPGSLPAPAPHPATSGSGSGGGPPGPAGPDPTPGVTSNLPDMTVHLIDVGQGASTLFEFKCGAVLVDTGGETNGLFDSGNALRAYLSAFFDRRTDLNKTLDLVVLTHPHKDHTLNAQMVAETYSVRNVVTDGLTIGSGGEQQKWLQDWARQHAHLETIDAAAVPRGGMTSAVIDPVRCSDEDPKLSVLWGAVAPQPAGWTKKAFEDENNHSVALRIGFGKASFLVDGDLEVEGIHELLAKHSGTTVLDVDVWEVGHHGSSNGTTQELLAAITPSIALLATGPSSRHIAWSAWAYGHPRKDTVDLLTASITQARQPVDEPVGTAVDTFETYHLNRAIYATGWDGSVTVRATNDGKYRVQTEH